WRAPGASATTLARVHARAPVAHQPRERQGLPKGRSARELILPCLPPQPRRRREAGAGNRPRACRCRSRSRTAGHRCGPTCRARDPTSRRRGRPSPAGPAAPHAASRSSGPRRARPCGGRPA
ncbi:MAG: hypothetical protein ACK53Y_28330, partial [bacterium]